MTLHHIMTQSVPTVSVKCFKNRTQVQEDITANSLTASFCSMTTSVPMWPVELKANRMSSDGRCTNILYRARTYRHVISTSLDLWRKLLKCCMVQVWCWCFEGVVQQPREFFSAGTCQFWHQCDTCLNAFAHPWMDFSCTCLIYNLRSCEYNTLNLHWNKRICPIPGRWLLRQKHHFTFLNF